VGRGHVPVAVARRLRAAAAGGDGFPLSGADGFSLAEAVVVLVLLAVFLGLAFSGRGLIDNRRLAGAARDLGTDVRFVEQRARAERRCWRIRFVAAGGAYTIESLAGGTWTAARGCSGGNWTTYRTESLPPRISLAGTTFAGSVMTATPYGQPTAGSVALRSAAGEQRRVIVNAEGMVSITR
jgi:Tfp pilus assembly protein FimT